MQWVLFAANFRCLQFLCPVMHLDSGGGSRGRLTCLASVKCRVNFVGKSVHGTYYTYFLSFYSVCYVCGLVIAQNATSVDLSDIIVPSVLFVTSFTHCAPPPLPTSTSPHLKCDVGHISYRKENIERTVSVLQYCVLLYWYEQFLRVGQLYQAVILLGLVLYYPSTSVSSIFMVLCT